MHSVEPGPDLFKRFKDPAVFAFSNVVIPFRIVPKPAFIARRVLSFVFNLIENCALFTQIRIDSKNDLFFIGSIIDRYQGGSSGYCHFENVYCKLLFHIPQKKDILFYQCIDWCCDGCKIFHEHTIINYNPYESPRLRDVQGFCLFNYFNYLCRVRMFF
jgi:hypothetical protein